MMNQEKPSLTDLICGFMVFASEKMPGVSFPPWSEAKPWHEFLYNIKKKLTPEFPELAETLDWFDWDAPYPKSPEAARLLHWIASIKCDCDFFSGRMKLRPQYTTGPHLPPVLAERMFEIAQTHENMLVIET
ncbi:MAG: hypothetical protein Q8R55_01870 [Candidatus Taylorbacteria bacterium]|nr:hypothetical protein [Candidatus Taylorbacteria bacterium]